MEERTTFDLVCASSYPPPGVSVLAALSAAQGRRRAECEGSHIGPWQTERTVVEKAGPRVVHEVRCSHCGETRYVLADGSPCTDPQPEQCGAIGTVGDLIDRLALLADALPGGVSTPLCADFTYDCGHGSGRGRFLGTKFEHGVLSLLCSD